MASEIAAVQRWRRQVLERVTLGSFLVATLNFAVDLREAIVLGDYRFLGPATIAIMGLGSLTFFKRLPWQIRTTGFVLLLLVACSSSLAQSGFLAPNTFVVGSGVTVLVAISIGTRAAYCTLAGFLACVVYAALVYVQGRPLVQSEVFNVHSLQAWVRVGLVFTACTSMAVFGVSLLTRRLREALSHGGELLETLRGEGRRQIAAIRQQEELQERLRRSQRLEALGRLSGGVAHDFNNLLSVILNHCAAARRNPANGCDDNLKAIEQAGRKAAALTRQMLSFGRQHSQDLTTTDLAEAVEKALDLVRRLLPSNIDLEFKRSQARTPIAGGPADVDQLVLNLCLNARDAMPEGGTLRVSVDEVHDGFTCCARLLVSDDGRGIGEQDQARIFEPFYTTKEQRGGTGLGLSVVQDVVRQHGGHIEVTSAEGNGATFSVLLPALYERAPQSGTRLRYESPVGKHVLLVEDEEDVRNVLERLARVAGYSVTACGTAEEALECLKQPHSKFDVVVTDIIMPHMTGKALYLAAQEIRPRLPFVFLSGYAACDLPASPEHGQFSHLPKPVTKDQLTAAIQEAMAATRTRSVSITVAPSQLITAS